MITRRAAILGGAGLLAGGLLAPSPAGGQPAADAQVLRRLVALEDLSAFAYATAAASPALAPAVVELAASLGDHDSQHARALVVQLEALGGSRPPAAATTDDAEALARVLGLPPVEPAVASGEKFLEWAELVESRQVAGCVQLAQRALELGLTQTVASVLGADAQHLAAIRDLRGRAPVRRAFETGA